MRANWVVFALIAISAGSASVVMAQPAVDCTMTAPSQILLGRAETATVTFSSTGTAPGFVPVVDLRVPSSVTIASAQLAGAAATVLPALPLTPTGVAHPVTGQLITGVAGINLVVVRLPLSSVAAELGALPLTLAFSSATAAADVPLSLQAQCAFAYGADALANPSTDAPVYDATPASSPTTPRVILVTSRFAQPNVCQGITDPAQQLLDIDVAAGVTVGPVQISAAFGARFDIDTASAAGSVATLPTGPGGVATFVYSSIAGAAGVDATIALTGHVLVGTVTQSNTAPVNVTNTITAHGSGGLAVPIPYVRGTASTTAAMTSSSIVKAHAMRVSEKLTTVPAVPGALVRAALDLCVADDFTFTGVSLASLLGNGTTYDGNPTHTPVVSGSDPTTVTFSLGTLTAATAPLVEFDTHIDQLYVSSSPVLGGDVIATTHTLAGTVSGGGAFTTTEALSGSDASYAAAVPSISVAVAAIDGVAPPPAVVFHAGQVVTYAISLTLPDRGAVTVDTFLPPVFSATEHGASGSAVVDATAPLDPIRLAATHDAGTPVAWTATAANNRIRFTVPEVLTGTAARQVRLLVDVTVDDAPVEDGLALTNVVTFGAAGTGRPASGLAFTSSNLGAPELTIAMNPPATTGVDAGVIPLEIRIANVGQSAAFATKVRQDFVAGLSGVAGSVTVADLGGEALAFTGDLFSAAGLTLTNPLPAGPGNASAAVIRFNVNVGTVAVSSTLTATGRLLGYASSPAGDPYPPAAATATVQTRGYAMTHAQTPRQAIATIGETLTYRMSLVVPESSTTNVAAAVVLDPELVIEGLPTVQLSIGVTTTSVVPVIAADRKSFTIPLGVLANVNDTPADELLTIDYDARVANIPESTDSDDAVDTLASLTWGASGAIADVASEPFDLEEPGLTLAITASPPTSSAGATVSWTATVSTAAGAAISARDVRVAAGDVEGVTITSVTSSIAGSTADGSGAVIWPAQTPAQTATVTITGLIEDEAPLGGTLTLPVALQWSSLAGDVPEERDYAAATTASVAISGALFTSTRITPDGGITIGDLVDLQLSINLPDGTFSNVSVVQTLPLGLSYDSSTLASATGVSCRSGSSGNFNPCTTLPTPVLTGQQVRWNLGNLRNSRSDGVATRSYTFVSRVRVANLAAVVAGVQLSTTEQVIGLPARSTIPFTVVEPQLTVTGSATPVSDVDGGDLVTLSGTLTNPNLALGASAYDAAIAVALQPDLVAVSGTSSCAGATFTSDSTTATLTLATVPLAASCTYTIEARLRDALPANSTVTMGGRLTWTSKLGVVVGERTGAGPSPDTYFATTATTTIVTRGGSSALITFSSTEVATDPPALFTGEGVTYDVAVTVPDGVSPGLALLLDPPPGVKLVSALVVPGSFAGAGLPAASIPLARTSGVAATLTLGPITATSGQGQVGNVFNVRISAIGTFDATNRVTPGGSFTSQLRFGTAAQGALQSQPVTLLLPHPTISLTAAPAGVGSGGTFVLTAQLDNHDALSATCATSVAIRLPTRYTAAAPLTDGLDNNGDGQIDEPAENVSVAGATITTLLPGCFTDLRAVEYRIGVSGTPPLPHVNVTATLGSYKSLVANTEVIQPGADALDTNGNGQLDEVGDPIVTLQLKPDSDGDGASDADELARGTNPADADSDDDGVLDGATTELAADADGDGLFAGLDADSDNDGLFDGTELGITTPHAGTNVARGHFIADADSGTTTNPALRDTDGGGKSDGAEDHNHNGVLEGGEGNPNAASDDAAVTDSDGDGLSNNEEALLGTSPTDADSDDDGLADGAEANTTTDVDGDGLVQPLDADSDNDGIRDGTERGLVAALPATDVEAGRFVADADPLTTTSLLTADTDRGGRKDGEEDLDRNGAVGLGERDPRVAADDGSPVVDFDGDGWSDAFEAQLGTDPLDPDSDDDGVLDGAEPNGAIDDDGDGLVNARDPDSDDDGLFDGTELGISAVAPRGTNLARGYYLPDADPNTRTNPSRKDSDGGGKSDGAEDDNRNGRFDVGEGDPKNAADDVSVIDSDGDGLSNRQEARLGTSPTDADSDDDGLRDGAEPNYGLDSDGDGALNALDPDSDNDGLYDGTERGVTNAGAGTDASRGRFVADAHPTSRTKMLVADTDRGGVSDGGEDLNKNGRVDAGEGNPLDPLDDAAVDLDGDGLSDAEEAALGTDPEDADSDDDGVLDGAEPDYAADSDGDGLLNALDVDSDDDGLHDGTELGLTSAGPDTALAAGHFRADADPSTRTSAILADSDRGGISDGNEDPNGNGRRDAGEGDPSAAADDATPIVDSDGDGLSDALEARLGTSPTDADSDDDGVADGAEPNRRDDHDGDGLINPLDPDSDDDLLFDGTERGVTAAGAGTNVGAGAFLADANPASRTSMLRRDDDGGGVRDGIEDRNRNGRLDAGETDPEEESDDGAPLDSDGDGLPDALETLLGTSPTDGDSDDDGLADGAEPNLWWDTDRDGLLPASDPDSDDDGLFDGTERGVTAALPDTDVTRGVYRRDADGGVTRTVMQRRDSDGGGISDGAEDLNKNGALDSIETNPNNPADDVAAADSDGDGLSNLEEAALGTDPADADSDDDGVADGAEPGYSSDLDGDGLIAPRDVDSDNDGLFDGTEMGVTAALPATDVSRGAFIADADPATRTFPQRADSDGGGVRDGAEDANRNGRVDAGESNPNDRLDDVAAGDGDGDGLSDGEEAALGTDPADADSDDDGVLDGAEPNWGADADGDGLINARDADSDNDRLFDGTELGLVAPHVPGTDLTRGTFRADADPATRTSPLLADSDGGGVPDGSEDIDRNGRRDAAPETDPTDRRDDTAPSDRDGDGLPDAEELPLGTDPDDADSDDDGIRDGREPNLVTDSDSDGLINPLDPDSDNDGLLDGTEVGLTSAGLSADTDLTAGNFLADADPTTQTNPLDRDTDGGGLRDGAEDANHNGRVDAGESDPRNRDDDVTVMADGDGDGLTDAEELFLGTSPADADSDDDGVLDGAELNFCCDTDRDGLGNGLDADSDNDGVLDGTEQGVIAADLGAGTDVTRGRFVADADASTTTRMLVRDSDGGGVIDGLEDRNSNGLVDGVETNAGLRSDDDITGDADGDTIYDVVEDVVDSDGDGQRDFLDLDSDGDTIRDADEAGDALVATAPLDSDGDKLADFRDPDSDGDTIRDLEEAGDADLATPAADHDADGLPDYRDLDADGDDRDDAIEAGDEVLATPAVDTDEDGAPDFLDLDSDGDGALDATDNCPITANADQADENRNGVGNVCEGDDDGDGVLERMDNCPGLRNPDQLDRDLDGLGDACDPDANGDGLRDDLKVEGGCAAGGGGSGWLLALGLAMMLLRRRLVSGGRTKLSMKAPAAADRLGKLGGGAALLLLAALWPAAAAAQPVDDARDFPLGRLRWALDGNGVLAAESASVPRHGEWGAALWLGYERAPLVLYAEDEDGRRRLGDLVRYRLTSELSGSVALWGRLQLGLTVPLVLTQDGDQMLAAVGELPGLGGTGLGDLRATAKLGALRAGALDLAVSAAVTVPTSTGSEYRGDDGVTLAPELVLSYTMERTRLAANLGWKIRGRAELLDLVMDDELYAVIGAGHRLGRSRFGGDVNVTLAAAASGLFSEKNQTAAELLAGPSYDVAGPLLASLVGGVALADGAGTPQWRVLLAIRFGDQSSVAVDRDGDGVLGDADRCPAKPEDRDGFQDDDGCPDPDNDGDGLLDADDREPMLPEDRDGFQDGDGAPDADNDGDDILDANDGCPDDAEILNGFEDGDGCPDVLPDGDGDKVRDAVDRCPRQAEDRDGYRDDDGCPEPDNDEDGVLDGADRCPMDHGPIVNAGCPDRDGDGDGVIDRLDNCPAQKGSLRFKGCAARQLVTLAAARLELAEAVRFKSDKGEGQAALDKKSFKLLDNVAAVLLAHPELVRLDVEGHTDDKGDAAANQALSQARADAVVAYLTGKGVAAERLRAIGYGGEQPIGDNKRSRGRAANRRVVLKIVSGPGAAPVQTPAPAAAAAPAG